jgi:ribosome-associated translation inhibitor RaiA
MQSPLKITFRDFPPSEAIAAKIQQQFTKLHRFCDRIISCQVAIEAPHQNHHKGKIYHVRINLSIPQGNIAINRDSEPNHAHENPYVAIRDAFAAT